MRRFGVRLFDVAHINTGLTGYDLIWAIKKQVMGKFLRYNLHRHIYKEINIIKKAYSAKVTLKENNMEKTIKKILEKIVKLLNEPYDNSIEIKQLASAVLELSCAEKNSSGD